MTAKRYPVPTFNPANFEFESRKETLRQLVPIYFNREPSEEERCDTLWAVEGLLVPGRPERKILAVNIGDIMIPDPAKGGEDKKISGEDIAGMLVSARLGYLAIEFPQLEKLDGSEARIVLPREARRPLYAEGVEKMHATLASLGAAASAEAETSPLQVAA